jgi:hypothetical protein
VWRVVELCGVMMIRHHRLGTRKRHATKLFADLRVSTDAEARRSVIECGFPLSGGASGGARES